MIWLADIKRAQKAISLDRRLIRTKHQSFMPIGPWAAWLTKELPIYDHGMMLLILLYSISIGIQAHMDLDGFANYKTVQILNIVDLICVSMFIYDIVLHLIDNAEDFLEDSWKVFDGLVTATVRRRN